MAEVIETAGLTKRFGRVHALSGLNLSVSHGEIHGFLGPNGAGKSTTIRILLGLERAGGGTVRVFDQDPWGGKEIIHLHRRLAYVPGDVDLWPNVSGGEAIDLINRLRGKKKHPEYAKNRQRLLDIFQLDPAIKSRNYSKGNRQKVALVAAFASPADLYIFDEPTSGLDPLMEAVFNQEVSRVAAEGATVFLSSHILSEVERLCERVTIIRDGAVVDTGSLADLRHLTRTDVSFENDDAFTDETFARIPGTQSLRFDRGRAHFTVESDDINRILPVLANMNVRNLTVTPPSLEELFLRHYKPAGTNSGLAGTNSGAAETGQAATPTRSPSTVSQPPETKHGRRKAHR